MIEIKQQLQHVNAFLCCWRLKNNNNWPRTSDPWISDNYVQISYSYHWRKIIISCTAQRIFLSFYPSKGGVHCWTTESFKIIFLWDILSLALKMWNFFNSFFFNFNVMKLVHEFESKCWFKTLCVIMEANKNMRALLF